MKYISVMLIFSLLSLFMLCASVYAEMSKLQQAEELLIDRNYSEAIIILQELIAEGTKQNDYLFFLIGNALFYQEQYQQAIEQYEQLVAEYPESVWRQKAIFKQAECYLKLKQFDRAEAIYERDVTQLVSPERKERIAEIYLSFAEEYFSGKWVERSDQQGVEKRPDYARAKTFYELALQMEISKTKAEEVRFQIARCAYELGNYAEAITTLTALQKDYPEGNYLTQVIYYLGQAYLYNGQSIQARKVLRDFIEEYPDNPKAAEAAFLISRTYLIPTPSSVEELELGVTALMDFVELYPNDERVSQAEYEIGLSYYNFDRYNDAIEAFTNYIKKYEGHTTPPCPPQGGISTPPLKGDGGMYFDGLPLARYYLGLVYQQQRKFEDALAVWKEYLQKHPADQQWSEVQRQVIESEYLIADRLFREEQYEAARAAWEQFLTDHPLDSRNPEIMYLIGSTFLKQELYQEAIVQWKRTVSKYPNTDPASQAQYEIGRALETKLLKLDDALEAYQLVTWGSYYYEAQNRIQEMQSKRLTVLTERAFRTHETPTLKITTRNIETLTLKMYKVDLETYFRKMQTTAGVDRLDIALIDPDETWQETIPSTPPSTSLRTGLRTGAEYEKYREFENNVPLKFTEPGAYLVTCSEENVSGDVGYEATTFVLITDLDMIVKTTKRDLLVFAQNMQTGKVYPNVKFLVSDGKKVIFEGTTGDDGVFHDTVKELQEVQDVRVFAYDGKHYASNTLNIGDLQYVVGLESRGYIYTDRPAYRPGQHVNIRGILREVDEQGVLRVPQISPSPNPSHQGRGATSPLPSWEGQGEGVQGTYNLQVLNPQGAPVFQEEVVLNDFGTFALDFALSSNVPTGEYRILLSHGKQTYTGTFLVEIYKLEKLKLTIDTDREVYFRGETIKGTIKAEYYYGEPVKGKKVTYVLAGLETLTAVTDEHGAVSFTLDTRDFLESQTLTLMARLDEENVQTGKTVWLATRGFACEVSTIRTVYLIDEDVEVKLVTRDPAGKPLSKPLSLGVFKRATTVYGEMVEVKVEEQQVTTAADGTGKTLVRIQEGGQYVLRAEGRDRFGNPVSGQTELFISGKEDEIKLRFITDREEFNVGEQPEVTLFSHASAGLGLLTYEGESIRAYQIIPIQEGKNLLTLSIESELAPNFTLAVTQMDGNKFHQAQKEFAVIQGLNIAIAPQGGHHPFDKAQDRLEGGAHLKKYQPGDTITLEITTTDHNGNPVPAEVSLAMVDEALYAQYTDRVPPIRDFFYDQRRGLLSKTVSSCTFSFKAVTKEIVTEILEEEQRVAEELEVITGEKETTGIELGFADMRFPPISEAMPRKMLPKVAMEMPAAPPAPETARREEGRAFLVALREYFPETGYWNPSIVTDANGKAIIAFELPDSTTTWRFTSRGITKATLVGETTAQIITKMPFFVEMKTAQVFTEGDKAVLLASIHNYSGKNQAVHMMFTGSMDSEVLERQEQQVTSENKSVLETEYRLDLARITKIETLMPLALEFAAMAENVGDRMKREVAVRPWGIEHVVTKSGTLQDDRQIEISLPGNRAYLYREMNILLNPSLDRTLVDLTGDVPWIIKSPGSSAIHEAIVVLNALNSLKPSESTGNLYDPALRKLQERLTFLLTEVCLGQNRDGGWNWTGRDERSDLFVTADAVTLVAEAQRQGYTFQSGILEKGINYLKREFQSAQDNEIKTYLLYALSIANSVDFAHVNRVYRERNSLHTSSLALLTLIYAQLNRPEIATEVLALLQNRAKSLTDPTTGKQTVYWQSDSPYFWLQGDVDTTALALLALQKAEPASKSIAAAVEWLYAQRRWIGWGSTRTNARVSTALLEYFANTQYATTRYILNVMVNGTQVQMLTVDSEQGLITLNIPAYLLKDQNNTVTFDFEGRGFLNYVCVLKSTSRNVQKTQQYYEVRRYYEPAPLVFQGKEIPRGFSVLDGSYTTWRNKLTQIPLGAFGRVTLEYHRREFDYEQPYKNHYLVIEEPIPAGCTVLTQSVQGGFMDYELAGGKIVFYLTNARYGTVSYDLYGYLPGEYNVLPTKIQSPYHPELLDYGEPYKITVLERQRAVSESYRKTPDELYYLGKALFETKRYVEARPLLQELLTQYRLQSNPYRDTARMLMYIAIAEDNSKDIVQYFEILKEKYPDLVISFEDIVKVGNAYREIREYERAAQVFKATAEASFLKDVQVSGTLEAQGEFLASVEYTQNIIFEYPDIPTTETAFYALAQLMYTEAARSKGRNVVESRLTGTSFHSVPDYEQLLKRTIGMLHQFLVRYPENPIVDEVSFSLANAYLDLEDFETAIQVAQRFQQRYPESAYLSGYQYIEGYASFELERYAEALKMCETVATSKYRDKKGRLVESDHKSLAIYIMGQIYHSMGKPEQAIAEYEKVKDIFPDARETVSYFTRKKLKLEEVTTFKPGSDEKPQVKLHYRNVKDVNLLVYRVDLMKLYLLQKNLNNITQINLAGITPYHHETIALGEGNDYADKEYRILLPLEKEGAYLIVAKEAELDTSGMVLLSVLKLEVDEDLVSGRVRVNVMNAETGRYENNVHVKVIGSGDTKFVSGETDLRGIFVGDNLHGAATVIARKLDQYAFYRGKAVLQPAIDISIQRPILKAPADMRSQAMQYLREDNIAIQQQSEQFLRGNLYQNRQVGVEVQSTY